MIEIIIADDHRIVRSAIKGLLGDVPGIKVIGEAETSDQAIQLARQLKPQVVLLDIHMPGSGAFQITRKLLRINPQLKIIIITAAETPIFPKRLLQSGVSGYLTKGGSKEELLQAIKVVCAHGTYLSPSIAQTLTLSITDTKQSPFSALTERELEIAIAAAQGMEISEIAKNLYLSVKTISGYRTQIFRKLNIETDPELTRLAIQQGLIDVDEM